MLFWLFFIFYLLYFVDWIKYFTLNDQGAKEHEVFVSEITEI